MTDQPTQPDQPDPPEEERTAETQPLPEAGRRPRRLLRSRGDRMLCGVAGGLGDYFRVDPLIVRIGFAVSVFFGGLGIIAYLALALFVPSEPAVAGAEPEAAPVHRNRWLGLAAAATLVVVALSAAGSLFFWANPWPWDGDGWGAAWLLIVAAAGVAVYFLVAGRDRGERPEPARIVAVAGLALAAVFGLGIIAAAAGWVAAVGSGEVIAAAVVAIGLMLVVAAFFGGARWLIAPALALAVPLAAVSAADISFAGGVGDREYRPATAASIPAEGYELGVGRLGVDLRGLDWERTEVTDLDLDLGIGEAVVVVPEDVCVEATLEAGVGALEAGGESSDGFDPAVDVATGAVATPRLELDAELDIGALRVVADDELDLGGYGWHHDSPGDEERERAAAACASR